MRLWAILLLVSFGAQFIFGDIDLDVYKDLSIAAIFVLWSSLMFVIFAFIRDNSTYTCLALSMI